MYRTSISPATRRGILIPAQGDAHEVVVAPPLGLGRSLGYGQAAAAVEAEGYAIDRAALAERGYALIVYVVEGGDELGLPPNPRATAMFPSVPPLVGNALLVDDARDLTMGDYDVIRGLSADESLATLRALGLGVQPRATDRVSLNQPVFNALKAFHERDCFRRCASCRAETTLKCSRCRRAYYCSRECQLADRPYHRGCCQEPSGARAGPS